MGRIAYETPEFRADFRRASKQLQRSIEGFIRKFDEDASRGGLRLKSPKGAPDQRVKVARVDQGTRAVVVDLGEGDYALVRVMEHDAAYEFARKLRPDVSSFNGLPRLIALPNHPDDSVAPSVVALPPDLFAHRRDRDFDAVGVPPFVVRPLRAMADPDEVRHFADLVGQADPLLGLAIIGLLQTEPTVDDVFAELVALEGGPDREAPRPDGAWSGILGPAPAQSFDPDDIAAALVRPGAEQRFRVVEDSEELVEALQGDFADWQIFLHPLQRKAAYERTYAGPARVSGGAGTGKTVVLIHRVKALLDRAGDDPPPRVLVTTFTTHLRQDLTRLLTQLIGVDRAALVDVRTVDGLARDLHKEMTGAPTKLLTREQEAAIWEELVRRVPSARSAAFLRNEYRHVLLARGVRTLDAYLRVPRAGRGVRLVESERRALWPVFEAFEAQTRQAGSFTTLQLTESVASLLEQLPAPMYDHVLVDEAQDLHASQWRLLHAIAASGQDSLFLVGDAFQRIYGDTVSLRGLGIETRGRSLRLRRNYRTTHQIVGWALGIVGDEAVVDIDELGADLQGYHSVRHGPRPRFLGYDDRPSEVEGLVIQVQQWLADGYAADGVAVSARTKQEVAELATALQRAGVPAAPLGRGGRVDGAVNVGTMHRLKGLEYPCVAVTGLADGTVPPRGAITPDAEDRAQHLADIQTERSLIYVAATRARDELVVSWAGEPTSLIVNDVVATAA
jgi:hypothetical protein